MSKEDLIEKCKKGDAVAQKALYHAFAPALRGVCLRYAKNRFEAEDIFQESFIKIFSRIKTYTGEGSFEGWLRRIVVNTAVDHFNKKVKNESSNISYEQVEDSEAGSCEEVMASLSTAELLQLIEQLPDGYRLIFNMYAIEGYSHKEIATMLGISEGTSKSQLSKARKLLQHLLHQYDLLANERRKTR